MEKGNAMPMADRNVLPDDPTAARWRIVRSLHVHLYFAIRCVSLRGVQHTQSPFAHSTCGRLRDGLQTESTEGVRHAGGEARVGMPQTHHLQCREQRLLIQVRASRKHFA